MVSWLLVLLTTGAAQAQSPQRPWVIVGLGSGSYRFDGGTPQRGGLGSVGLRLHVAQTFQIGIEVSLLLLGEGSTHAVLSGMLYLYPSGTGHLFFKVGLGSARLDRPNYGSSTAEALVGGLGYDIRVSDKASLTPFLDGGLQALNPWWQFGLAVSFR